MLIEKGGFGLYNIMPQLVALPTLIFHSDFKDKVLSCKVCCGDGSCTARGFLDHSLKEDCAIMTISIERSLQ